MADKVYTVGQVSKFLSDMISSEYSLRRIYVRGEVSNCKYHSLGHIYFTLKDEKASIQAVMFKGNRSGLPFQLRDGQAIVVEGEVGFYDKETKINLYARRIAVDGPGEGKLHLLYEQLKLKLNEEGLFEFEKKKPIPKHPKKVGIVTAATGAAIQDICNIAKRRNPYVELILYPAKVQGEGAAATIARGIRVLDSMGLDTIIVGRGGGSIEDLWAFNEEEVARAIYEAKTPIISGTGHETDNTIADYVADLRAPTPSAAAELAVPDIMTTLRKLSDYRNTIDRQMDNRIRMLKLRQKELEERLNRRGPENRLRMQQLRLTGLSDRLHSSMDQKMKNVQHMQDRLERELHPAMQQKFRMSRHRMDILLERLNGLSPTAKLRGGYGFVEVLKESTGPEAEVKTEPAAKNVLSAKDVSEGDLIRVTVHDGTFTARVEK